MRLSIRQKAGLVIALLICLAGMANGLAERSPLQIQLEAISYGWISQDQATQRYYRDSSYQRWQGTADGPANVWLRLKSLSSEEELKCLRDFRVIKGRAACAPLPVPVLGMGDMDFAYERFLPMEGYVRGALELRLDEGERLQDVVIAFSCSREMENGKAEQITGTLDLSKVYEDSGIPEGAVRFTATRYTPFLAAPDMARTPSLGQILQDNGMEIVQAPQALLDLPANTEEAGLYLLEGRIDRDAGSFGVHDVGFALQHAPPGVWIAPYQRCLECDEVDAFDIGGGEQEVPHMTQEENAAYQQRQYQTISRSFAILLLVDRHGRDEAAIDSLIRDLSIRASFSGEQWNKLFEQHMLTTAIGPRSHAMLDLSDLSRGEQPLSEIP